MYSIYINLDKRYYYFIKINIIYLPTNLNIIYIYIYLKYTMLDVMSVITILIVLEAFFKYIMFWIISYYV